MTELSALDILKHPQSGDKSDLKEAIECAVKALEKRTPKKVNLNTISHVKALDVELEKVYTYEVVRCPECDKPMVFNKARHNCEKCGQALDWGDKE